MIEVRNVDSQVLKQVRHQVLWPHLENETQATIDIDQSEFAMHLAAFHNGNVVGVASLFRQNCDRFPQQFKSLKVRRLRAMGVLHHMRGEGVGSFIIQKAMKELKLEGVDVVWCDAREVAWGFYESQGFKYGKQINGEDFPAYTVPDVGLHKMMFKSL
tara:strand:+ start:195 stop:668 length:474 start_codon:yes stop_codon:yes gene_type:complete